MNIAEAKQRITIFTLGAMLYPEWKPGRVCRAPWRDDRSPSFSVSDDGALFNDFTGEGGDAIAFLARAKDLNMSDAAKELIRLAGGSGYDQVRPPIRHAQESERKPYQPVPMPDCAAACWAEGMEHLANKLSLQSQLVAWRGWPLGALTALISAGLVSCPMVHGGRAVAWKVEAPLVNEKRFDLMPVGFHARIRPLNDGERASWRFMPNEREHGSGIPSLPFVMGSLFPEARKIIATEGQWDAVSLAIAAGWPATPLPDGVVLFGLRGAQGIKPFLENYSPFWPEAAEAILIPDNDTAGSTWHIKKEGGKKVFIDQMADRCSRVRVVKVPGNQKDLNDALRAGDLKNEWVRAILEG